MEGEDLEETGKGEMVWYEMRYIHMYDICIYTYFLNNYGKKGKIE